MTVPIDSPEGRHQDSLAGYKYSKSVTAKQRFLVSNIASSLAKNWGNEFTTREAIQEIASSLNASESCTDPSNMKCNPNELYRSADGSCNNLVHPDWGKSFTPYIRILPPEYGTRVTATGIPLYDDFPPRTKSVTGKDLPSSRRVSFTVDPDIKVLEPHVTTMLMSWGQFIDHDITGAATTRLPNGMAIRCCGQDVESDLSLRHPACFPIPVPPDDPIYSVRRQTCMNFVRSAAAVQADCQPGPREQLNQLSAFIDASHIYGRTRQEQMEVRSFKSGQLKISVIHGHSFLPQRNIPGCKVLQLDPTSQPGSCFFAGDRRVNENVGMAGLQGLFLRHHNKIASGLENLNPSWSDEKLFQEARRIIIAQIQVITYREFLPVLLGEKTITDFGLSLVDSGYTEDYDENINPGIGNTFSAAAYRLHTLVQARFQLWNPFVGKLDAVNVSFTNNSPSILFKKQGFTQLLNGMSIQELWAFDRFFTNEVSHKLFRDPGTTNLGLDLVSINIQRGRDHGIPRYTQFQSFCGLPQVNSWNDLSVFMTTDTIKSLMSVYESVNDIDLYAGGSAERTMEGSAIGPTFACLISEQFKRLKIADRFWFENQKDNPYPFTPEQLSEIRKTSLAGVLCESGIDIEVMQDLVMYSPSLSWNLKKPCSSFSRFSLFPWETSDETS